MALVSYEDFLKITILAGTILSAEENNELIKPSIVLSIDFGENIGIKKSSAQLKKNYQCRDLVGKQVAAVINFSPMQIGNFLSEVLVLGFPDENKDPILISPDTKIINGKRLF